MTKFKVGDIVTRNNKTHPHYGVNQVVTKVGQSGWFNHSGPESDYDPSGGCCPEYWDLVKPAVVPTARANDPATSKGKRKVNKYEQVVLAVLAGAQHTGKEIAEVSGHPLNCITPRFAPLSRKGLIKDSGVKRDKQIVWVLA